MLRGMFLAIGLVTLLLAGGCKDREQSTSQPASEERPPAIEQGNVPASGEKTGDDIVRQADQAEEKTEKAKERLEAISDQALALAREAKVVGEKVDSVTQQVADLNTRLDQVAGAAREVIEQAQQALKQVEKARENLKNSAENLVQEFVLPSEPVLPLEAAPEMPEATPPNVEAEEPT